MSLESYSTSDHGFGLFVRLNACQIKLAALENQDSQGQCPPSFHRDHLPLELQLDIVLDRRPGTRGAAEGHWRGLLHRDL